MQKNIYDFFYSKNVNTSSTSTTNARASTSSTSTTNARASTTDTSPKRQREEDEDNCQAVVSTTNASVKTSKRQRKNKNSVTDEYDETDEHTIRQRDIVTKIVHGEEKIHLLVARAGCTKTSTIVMSIKEIKRINQDTKILYAAYNSPMKDEARRTLKKENCMSEDEVKTCVHTYDSLRGYILGLPSNNPEGKHKSEITLPDSTYVRTPEFDYMFVDEAQDLCPQFFHVLNKLHIVNPEAKFIFCGDPHQNIYDYWKDSLKADHRLMSLVNEYGSFQNCRVAKHELFTSKRVTTPIANVISNGLMDDPNFLQSGNDNEGLPVDLYETRQIGKQLYEIVVELQEKNVPMKDIVVLVPTRTFIERNTNFLKDVKNNFSVRLASSKNKATQTQLNIQTMHSSKGLEWKYVIVLPFDESLFNYKNFQLFRSNNEIPNVLYVALSRAKTKLILIGSAVNPMTRFLRDKCGDGNLNIIKTIKEDENNEDNGNNEEENKPKKITKNVSENAPPITSLEISQNISDASFQNYIDTQIEIETVHHNFHGSELSNIKTIFNKKIQQVTAHGEVFEKEASDIIKDALIPCYELYILQKHITSTNLYQFCSTYFEKNDEDLKRCLTKDERIRIKLFLSEFDELNDEININKLIILRTCICAQNFECYRMYPHNYIFMSLQDRIQLGSCLSNIISNTSIFQNAQFCNFDIIHKIELERDKIKFKAGVPSQDEVPKLKSTYKNYEITCVYDSIIKLKTQQQFVNNFSFQETSSPTPNEILNAIICQFRFLNSSTSNGIFITNFMNGNIYRINICDEKVRKIFFFVTHIVFCDMSFNLKRKTTTYNIENKMDDVSYIHYINLYLSQGDQMYGRCVTNDESESSDHDNESD